MDQRNVELLSSEELGNVIGGNGVTDVLKGVGNGVIKTLFAPVFGCFPTGKCGGYGTFDTNNISESITRVVTNTAVAGAVVYAGYELAKKFCSKSEEEQEEATPAA